MSKKTKGEIYIGTSGWVYNDWQGIFYPGDLRPKDRLRYFSDHFKTTEINYSFYHLPKSKTYENWYNQTPDSFVFAVKASRFITHVKRLKEVKSAWDRFLENALYLKEKLGPILFQLPPSFRASHENVKRLEEFLQQIANEDLRFAFEFRHENWCNDEIYRIIKKYNVAWVIADSPRYPKAEVVTADFVYIRMHGSEKLFSSKYSIEEIEDLAEKIKIWYSKGSDIYTYFNNDFHGYAIENARELLKLLSE
ncbi:MAG: DUF72 domain-containing protein [Thermodesulfobacteriota bacterium]